MTDTPSELADTEASLRRIAVLVADGAAPEKLFDAVTKEVLRRFGSGTARMIRFESDGTATVLANAGTSGPHVKVGGRWENYPPSGLTATVRATGAPARVDDYGAIPGGEPYLREGLRSSVGMPINVSGRLWGMIAVGAAHGPLPPDTECRMTQFTDLLSTAIATAQHHAELIASRTRLVSAADEARRRITRDLHDGAQQRLVGLALRLRAAADYCTDLDDVRHSLRTAAADASEITEELREMANGIHPAVLTQAGLGPALRGLGRRSAIPTEVRVSLTDRLPAATEICAYYIVSELLTNAAKHAHATAIQIDAHLEGTQLLVSIRDNGIGGADAEGSGLTGVRDRVATVGGTCRLESPPGRGTHFVCRLPAIAAPQPFW
ncbi:histidine kinase [Mycobacterium sp. ACS1612]|uniref:GAF domain-containing sensor histidine kinase n=1 Tax=Mycobacterium sp. ACS1612 TaxID=1834117 RepID=UPI0007FEDFD2|nr:GAF domain-containing sensor histidine kinase [Mycobacterium sp. ACS1612]OBF30855.1 histidine kinase [Mycobacterium sp. ACS1612]